MPNAQCSMPKGSRLKARVLVGISPLFLGSFSGLGLLLGLASSDRVVDNLSQNPYELVGFVD